MAAAFRKYDRQAVWRFIKRHKREHDGNSPSYRTIGAEFGIPTPSAVYKILDDLAVMGYLKPRKKGRGQEHLETRRGKWNHPR